MGNRLFLVEIEIYLFKMKPDTDINAVIELYILLTKNGRFIHRTKTHNYDCKHII